MPPDGPGVARLPLRTKAGAPPHAGADPELSGRCWTWGRTPSSALATTTRCPKGLGIGAFSVEALGYEV